MENKYSVQVVNQPSEDEIRFIGLSLRAYNESIIGKQEAHPLQVIILDQAGAVIGGASGSTIWGWGSPEQFWLHPEYRHTKLHDQLLQLTQNEVLQYNVDKIHIKAIFDHDIELFQRNQYQLFAELEDRPPGYTCYYYKAEGLQPQSVELDPSFTCLRGDQVTDEHIAELERMVNAEYDQVLGEIPFEFIRVFARDGAGQIVGGLNGYIGWGWFYVMTLWVDEKHRGQDLGSHLLAKGEEQALLLGVNKAFLGTTEFQARGFYEKNGYAVFGQMEDLPPGYTNFMLRKNLS